MVGAVAGAMGLGVPGAVAAALREPNGLLAIGGDLSPERLLHAYRHGIFPWYSDEQPILWWSPQPRFVIYPDRLKVSRSLGKTLRRGKFQVTVNQALNVLGDGRREKQCLTLLGQSIDNRVDFLEKAHRKHLVGFVEDQDSKARSVDGAAVQMVEHASRRSADDSCALS